MNDILLAVALVTGIGLFCALILVVASHFMSVKVDETEKKIREVLPGANCGACGYAGCDQYAKALASQKDIKTNLCVPGADAVSKQISEILGVEFADVIEQVAQVRCQGNCSATSDKMQYDGIPSCAAANMLYAGKGRCAYGCIGLGDCVNVCPSHAICLEDGIAHIDTRKCTGCGLCAKTCPKHIIALFPDVDHVTVSCSNPEKGAVARAHCKSACIGCKKCEGVCPTGAIKVENNLAHIDYSKCIDCTKCAQVCPDKCILISDNAGIHRFTQAQDAENAG